MKPNLNEYSLTLYFYPSPYGIDWSSPKSLTKTAILNQFNRIGRSIGHVHIELKSPEHHIITGMTQKSKTEERKLLFIDQIGYGILLHSFQGAIEETHNIIPEIERRKKIGKFSFLKFEITKHHFERAYLYLEEYKKYEFFNQYGLANRPRFGEGAGCTAFAASFLEVTGLMLDEFKSHWTNTVKIPHHLAGGKFHKENKKVPLWKLLFHDEYSSWAEDHEPHHFIYFWDPDRMHQWCVHTWNHESKHNSGKYKLIQEGKAKGLILNASHHSIPDEPLWKK